MPTSGIHIIDAFVYVACDTCGWEGGTDVTIDLEEPVSMRTQQFDCPNGHHNERPIE